MPQITDCTILELPAQHTLSISFRTDVSKLPALIGEAYGKIGALVGKHQAFLSGMPYVAYLNMDMNDLEVEIGMPVSKPIEGEGDVVAGEIPAGKFATCMYLGSYAEVEPTYEALAKFVAGQGLTPSGISYEHYLNGPNYPESQYLTEIRFPVS